MGRMVDHDTTCLGLGIGIAATRQTGDDAAFCGDHIDGTAGRAGLQVDLRADLGLDPGQGSLVGPGHRRLGQNETLTGVDQDDGDRRLLALDQILDLGLVIALRPQQRLCGFSGGTGMTARLEPAGGRTVDLADDLDDPVAQLVIHIAANARLRVRQRRAGGQAEDREGGQQEGSVLQQG